jgi:RES domain-containing protein
VWRLVNRKHMDSAFTGDGARLYGGRWTSPGRPVVYAAESACAALLELLSAPIDASPHLANRMLVLKARLALTSEMPVVRTVDLPSDWRSRPGPASLRAIGDEWFDAGNACALSVPSVPLPSERIYLLNTMHRDFASLARIAEEPIYWPSP